MYTHPIDTKGKKLTSRYRRCTSLLIEPLCDVYVLLILCQDVFRRFPDVRNTLVVQTKTVFILVGVRLNKIEKGFLCVQ